MMRPRASRASAVALAVVLLASCACGGGGDDDGREGGRGGGGTEGSTTTQPRATDQDAVRPYIEDLLGAWDEAMTRILADPRPVIEDSNHRLRRQLTEIFTNDSPYMGDLNQLLQGYVDQDTGLRAGPSGLAQQTTFLDFTRTPNADHVSFVACTFTDGVDYALSTGEERPASVGIRQVAGDATRVEGKWLLHRLQRLGFETQPAGTPNPCPDLAAPTTGGDQS